MVAQNLPYGTHILTAPATSAYNTLIDGVEIVSGNNSINYPGEFHIHQPKMPPIPEDAVVIADYMLMADYVKGTAGAAEKVSKGIRLVSSSRDILYDGIAYILNTTDVTNRPFAMRAFINSTPGAGTGKQKLPAFGTHVELGTYAARGDIFVDGVDMAQTATGSAYTGLITQDTASTLGNHIFESRSTGNNHNTQRFGIASPIHTSSHYQTFETPYLFELVGGDRNMEQTNLVVTADGKSWDQVTRDTSYMGVQIHNPNTDTAITSTTAKAVFDEYRGTASASYPYCGKNFAPAYDRQICLVDGTYRITHQTINSAQSTVGTIKINGATVKEGHDTNVQHGHTHTTWTGHMKRGDYVQIEGKRYQSRDYSKFEIIKLD
jgi:hypothetical protein